MNSIIHCTKSPDQLNCDSIPPVSPSGPVTRRVFVHPARIFPKSKSTELFFCTGSASKNLYCTGIPEPGKYWVPMLKHNSLHQVTNWTLNSTSQSVRSSDPKGLCTSREDLPKIKKYWAFFLYWLSLKKFVLYWDSWARKVLTECRCLIFALKDLLMFLHRYSSRLPASVGACASLLSLDE